MSRSLRLSYIGALLVLTRALPAQVLDLTIHDVGIAVGDKPEMTGVRLNYRDRNLREVTGVNATIWSPYEPASGTVNGLALGLPVTGAGSISGLTLAVLGAGTTHRLTGLGVSLVGFGSGDEIRGIYGGALGVGAGGSVSGLFIGGLGVGSGRSLSGIGVGGLGVGAGGDVDALAIGGLGVGAGGDFRGIGVGGLGVGAGGGFHGIGIGGLGVGAGGPVEGILIGGLGVGGGGSVTGLAVGGLGVGSGGDITGVTIGGVGIGSGGMIRGVALAVGGIGAPGIRGVTVSLVAGGHDVHAIVLAPAYFRIENDGSFAGASLSAYNRVRGTQQGLTIGIVNYARELHGMQVGMLNISDNDGHRRVFPILSVR